MKKAEKRIFVIVFIAIIYIVGAATVWNCKGAFKKAVMQTDGVIAAKAIVEKSLTENFMQHNRWINLNGGYQRVLGTTIVRGKSGDVYKLSNGHIMYKLPKRDMTYYAERISEFKTALDRSDIDFMYIQIPFKIRDDSYMPSGTHANGNENAQQLVSLIKKREIDTINITDEIEKAGLDWDKLFFKTDHHWLPGTGLWSAGLVMDHISEKYDYTIDKTRYETKNYKKKIYKDWMLGSIARRTGAWYAGVEDFYLMDPKFETNFDFYGTRKGVKDHRSGDFWNSMYYFRNVSEKQPFDVNMYATYTGEDYSLSRIKNKKAPNDLKLLVISDSFSRALCPFMSLNAKEITVLDLRAYKKKSALEYAEEYDPDLVIVAINPSQFNKEQFDFGTDRSRR